MASVACLALLLSTASAAVIPNTATAASIEVRADAPTCTGPVSSSPSTFWLDEMDHTGDGRGYAPELGDYYDYPTYRNVMSSTYGAVNDGSGDQTDAIQNAINDDGQGGNRYSDSAYTKRPAEVFIPGGTYQICKQLDLRIGTILVGDPQNPPIIKPCADFSGGTVINGRDAKAGDATTVFFIAVKNIVIDTTAVDGATELTALDWTTSQACHLTNIKINMPTESTGHTGIHLTAGSSITITDIEIVGGAVGINHNNQQASYKNVSFSKCRTGLTFTGGHTVLVRSVTFSECGVCIDAGSQGSIGELTILDATRINSGPVVKFYDSSNDNGDRDNQVVIQNLKSDLINAIAVDQNGDTKLDSAESVGVWVWGNAVPGNYETGVEHTTTPPSGLLSNGQFLSKAQPTYAGLAADQIVNVKTVSDHIVKGDASTDDAASLNAILAQNAADCKVTYFPFGVYVVKETLVIPPNSRIVGEAWPVIMGVGEAFESAENPTAVVQVGAPDSEGVAEIQDMRFTVGSVLPGAIIVEVNMAGAPGDVGIWNSQITVGGTAESSVNDDCSDGDAGNCMAAFAMVHLTTSSSAYLENVWGWTADHSLDGGPDQRIATGRGLLVEATKGTWLSGTGFEHNWLYNYNFVNAQNVFAGLQQTETAYFQGDGARQAVPAPWTPNSSYGDPDYSWCDDGANSCRMGLAQNIDGGSNIYLYNAAFWAFFHGEWDSQYGGDDPFRCGDKCQANMARVVNDPTSFTWYGMDTSVSDKMIQDTKTSPAQSNNPGGWSPFGGQIAAYVSYA